MRVASKGSMILAVGLLAACAVPGTSSQSPITLDGSASSMSPIESPYAQPMPSASGALVPSFAPGRSPTPMLVAGLLPPGSEARVVVDSLRLRSEPRANGPILATMPRNAIVKLDGPPFQRSADGIEWRSVRYASAPGGTSQSGWAAAGDGADAFLVSEQITCPTEPPDAETLVAMSDWAHVTCFADQELVVEGSVVTGFGGTTVGSYQPGWLASPLAFGGVIQAKGALFLYILRDGDGLATDWVDGQKLRIAGHYDDPAAATCAIAYGEPAVPEPESLAVAYCRGKFVATAIEQIGN